MSGRGKPERGTEWLAAVADRVRAPVNHLIQTSRELLETQLQPLQRDQVRELLGGAEQIRDHVDDLLDYISIEAGTLALQSIDFDLRVMMDGVTRSLELQGSGLSTSVHHTVPSRLRGDPGRLRQVLTALAGQALRRAEGDVSVNVQVAGETETQVTVRFTISTPAAGGDEPEGLGPAIAGHLAAMMGGTTGWHESDGVAGIWFTAVLDKREEVEEGEPARVAGDQRILVACDDVTSRATLIEELTSVGVVPDTADDMARTRERVLAAISAGSPYSVAIIDLQGSGAELEELARDVKQAGGSTRLILIAAMTRRGDAARMEAAGYAAYLTKSVRSTELQACLSTLSRGAPPTIITRHTLAERRKHALRILLVEHNTVNRKLAERILTRLGYRVEAVGSSKEALEILERDRRELLLISVHLPDRDGLETARIVRDPASQVRQHDIPIVGITTRVAAETVERCVAAGMNDCLVRPIEPEDLRRAIERQLRGEPQPAPGGAGVRTSALYNRRELLERMSGDEDLLRDVLRTFIAGAPPMVEAMHRAVLGRDARALWEGAQRLTDAAANVSAEGVRSLAHRIERAGRAGELGEVPALLGELQALLESLGKHVS